MASHEGKTREVRGTENPTDTSPADSDREGTATASSQGTGSVSVGTVGADSAPSNYFGSLAGGIIGQLIEQCEERLTEARECIDWYTREVDRIEKRLADLRQLEELAKQTEQE